MKKGMKIILMLMIIILIMTILVFGINNYIILKTKNSIVSSKDARKIENVDCILILGAGVVGDKPTHMLEDRLLEGIDLYKNGVASKIIMSGDHGQIEYDEVNLMKKFAIDAGIGSKDIFMDHAGFSTYESLYRAKEIFQVKKLIIVTQEYHLYRALYIAEALGLEGYGVASNPRKYTGQTIRELREILARDKDFMKCIIKPEPKYLGEIIPVNGDGDITNDK